jgi:hypothetical protein
MKKPVQQFVKYFNSLNSLSYKYCYIAIDVHNTIFIPTFDKEEKFEYFRWAKQCLQILSKIPNIKLIMWTGTYKDKLKMYLDHFKENNIHFDYINENPECTNSNYACFDNKFYFDIGFDDKFGFDGNIDWTELYPELIKHYINNYENRN